ncbi:MAG TPA: type II toxin-antitoxin system RelE/ParE family toxin [Candidatus Lokiarchaeia archaeon]|nr:type II toxin-antitoxin system RelE/ParE family toxin [Candidatus Lokiarchaeia archaeon]
MFSLEFLPEAKREMLEAARYYEERATHLGMDFLAEVEQAVNGIRNTPRAWPIVEGKLRRRLVKRFPYGVL